MDAAAQLNAALIGRYTIDREIGAGGMATVYVARDIRHDRRVALKVLNPELGAVLGVERFLAEIKVTANLQHPNLLPLFDSGEADGLLFYVMPFIAGETLRARLTREKQLPIDEALRITTAVASALDYAHRHGVVHRDLKPENILLHEGQPLVADFGIALAVSNAGGARITQTGLSLGTPQYMSPEQATGDRVIDGRTDIYSLGAVLYEMLTGEPPHTGNTVQAVIARVLTESPRSVRGTRANVPEHVELAIRRALEKLPADRWSTGSQFADALQGRGLAALPGSSETEPATTTVASGARRWVRSPVPWAGAFVIATAVAVVGWRRELGRPDGATVRFTLVPSKDHRLAEASARAVGLSRDGRTLVYVGSTGSARQLYVRRLDELSARALPGTRNPFDPTISPDGKYVAFASDARLRKVPIEGGPVVVLSPTTNDGISWSADGTLFFARSDSSAARSETIWQIRDTGADAHQVTKLDASHGEQRQWSPVVSDAANLILYTSVGRGGLSDMRIAAIARSTGKVTQLGVRGVQPLGLIDDILVYLREDGTIMAVPFDARAVKVIGEPVQVSDGVLMQASSAAISLSPAGMLAFIRGSSLNTPVLVDRTGKAQPLVESSGRFAHPRLSPDGSRIVFDVSNAQTSDIWLYEIASRTLTRMTMQGTNDRPEWTPDGKRVVYLSDRSGSRAGANAYSIWWQPADGSGAAEKLVDWQRSIREAVVAPGGTSLVFREDNPTTGRNIFTLSLGAEHVARPFLTSEFDELMPRVSPNGNWLLYQSDESGQYEVYLRPFPDGGTRVQVSSGGGTEPVWSPDAHRVFYRQDQRLMAATFVEAPVPTITTRDTVLQGNYDQHPFHPNYDVARDGKFIMLKPADEEPDLVVVTNWLTELRARLKR